MLSCIVTKPQDSVKAQQWAEKTYTKLSLSEKVSQLFMVAAYSNQNPKHQAQISSLITQENIGGFIFFQGTPKEQARLTNLYQTQSKIPFLIGMDAEFGLGMRLNGGYKLPLAMLLGAASNSIFFTSFNTMQALTGGDLALMLSTFLSIQNKHLG